ncbi:MAG: polysaccharide biosynthesis/export family protein [Verrucomicrobiae bacterium]|nr:polysaccharide biosynthesis/export family protein [Verrucomicrobiae bacterium]MCP5538708.1 polysaccharide biosynthesis/export family protein [Akkermansiaceae bacterium]
MKRISFPTRSLAWLWLPLAIGTATAPLLRADEAVLRSGDRIRLQIKGVPDEEKRDLDGDYTVSESGTIPLPYIDDPVAAGLKPSALAGSIEKAYREAQIYTNPTIVINFGDERVVRRVSLTGGVNRSGPVDYFDGMTLLEAVSAAGGLTDFAKQKEVKIIRGKETTVHDLEAIVKDSRRDIVLMPGDVVVVPENGRKL